MTQDEARRQRKVVYLDNAATSWPKAPGVADAVRDFLLHIGANPGRSGHIMSANAARVVFDAREAVAELLGVSDSRRLIFTQNATEAINVVLQGWLRPGDHVVATSLEHNAVMRPLRWLREQRGVALTLAPADAQGRTRAADVAAALTERTRLVVVNHASNVSGTFAPLAEIRAAAGDVPLLVDAAQTAGALEIDVERDGVDFLACAGHKGLLGPPGTGCLYIRPGLEKELAPLMWGGTGSRSDSDEQPEVLPDRFESGTRNAAGIAGLGVAARYLLERGVGDVRAHELRLTARLVEGLRMIDGVTVYGPAEAAEQVGTVSIRVAGLAPSEVSLLLDRRHGVMTRAGLHCAPLAHRTLGTFPEGTVRFGLSALSTAEEMDHAIYAVGEVARGVRA